MYATSNADYANKLDIFTCKVTDANGDVATAVVTVTIVGASLGLQDEQCCIIGARSPVPASVLYAAAGLDVTQAPMQHLKSMPDAGPRNSPRQGRGDIQGGHPAGLG